MLFVDELARCGLQDVCIAPGSRSTPLALAFYANPEIRIHTHLDERSAGFYALGMALAADRPIALVCTSGTAVANFFPAVVEANMSQVPLLLLTADRPPELRHSGANQTIDQIKLFGDHVLWAVDVATPQKDAPEIALRNLRTLAARAVAIADGFRKGPVHLNFPFRKPLEPQSAADWIAANAPQRNKTGAPFTRMERGNIRPLQAQIDTLADLITKNSKGLIICGPCSPGDGFAPIVGQLAKTSSYPLLADPLSGLRYGPHVKDAPICGAYETFLRWPELLTPPEVIIRFGAVPTSNRLNRLLASTDSAVHIQIRENGVWADENHMTGLFLQVNELELCLALEGRLGRRSQSEWLESWIALEKQCWSALDETMGSTEFDGAYVADLLSLLPEDGVLLSGNSLPIRHVDQFARPSNKPLQVFANRGASGIDGNISTGLGIAAQSSKETAVLTGDITFYHDSNGLLALRHLEANNVTFVILNNGGGGIFRRLPIANFEPPFKELFQASSGLDLAAFANVYDLDYQQPSSRAELRGLLSTPLPRKRARLIEITTDAAEDNRVRQDIEAIVGQRLAAFWEKTPK